MIITHFRQRIRELHAAACTGDVAAVQRYQAFLKRRRYEGLREPKPRRVRRRVKLLKALRALPRWWKENERVEPYPHRDCIQTRVELSAMLLLAIGLLAIGYRASAQQPLADPSTITLGATVAWDWTNKWPESFEVAVAGNGNWFYKTQVTTNRVRLPFPFDLSTTYTLRVAGVNGTAHGPLASTNFFHTNFIVVDLKHLGETIVVDRPYVGPARGTNGIFTATRVEGWRSN